MAIIQEVLGYAGLFVAGVALGLAIAALRATHALRD
jgi:hypothetical protein